MAATTTLLDLVTPTQGTLSGTWGDTVNYGISDYVDIAIAGTLSFAGDGAITLVNTIGSASGNNIGSTTAQYMVIRVTGTLTTPKIITAPSRSKLYLVDNAATGSTVSFIRAGQTPAVSIAVGEKAFVFYNGTDYVKIAGTTSGSAGGSNTQVQFNSSGALAGSANMTFDGTNFILGAANPLFQGSSSTGSAALCNNSAGAFVRVYGGSHATRANFTDFINASSTSTFDSAGSLGLGITPSASTLFKTMELGTVGNIIAGRSGSSTLAMGANWIYNSGFKYANNGLAAQYEMTGGVHYWYNAASGTAGNAVTFTQAMTLDASGQLAVGATSPLLTSTYIGKLSVYTAGGANLNVGGASNTTNTVMSRIVGVNQNNGNSGNDAAAEFQGITSIETALVTSNSNVSGDSGGYLMFKTKAQAAALTERARIDAVGNVLVGGTAARGTTVGTAHLDLFNGTAPAGTLTNGVSLYSDSGDLKFMNAAGDAFDVGYRNIPQNSQSADYTLTLADAGDHIFHPVGDNNARTFTIPANSSVAYPIGTAITFINMAAANVTIAITSDTMYLSSAGTTGSRTLAQYGSATAIKITSTNWLISGSGLT